MNWISQVHLGQREASNWSSHAVNTNRSNSERSTGDFQNGKNRHSDRMHRKSPHFCFHPFPAPRKILHADTSTYLAINSALQPSADAPLKVVIFHKILELFTRENLDASTPEALTRLLDIADSQLRALCLLLLLAVALLVFINEDIFKEVKRLRLCIK